MKIFSSSLKSKAARFRRTMPDRVTNMVAKHYDRNFDVGGWQRASTVRKWEQRKKHYKHPTLDKTGTLRGSQRVVYTPTEIIVEYTAPYAKFHNDPTGSWGNNVQRQFVGDNKTLTKSIKKFIRDEFKKIMR